MLNVARKTTGLDDIGDAGFISRGKEWLRCATIEGHISPAGQAGLEALITGWLINRLRFVDDLKRHSEMVDETVAKPIFITGMPRTGTTKLQRVISCDSGIQSLPFWLVLNMAPVPGADPSQPDPRIAMAAGYIELMRTQYPDFLAGHPVFVDEPEEECFWMESDFQSLTNAMRVRSPSYLAQIIDSPDIESYPYLKTALQYSQWQRKEDGKYSWVLKTPSHLGNLPVLFKTFPDATVVHCYRDPVIAIGSICRIFELFRSLHSDDIDLKELGAEQLALWARMQQRHMKARENPAIDTRIIDVHYDDLCDDILSVVRAVYQKCGRQFDASLERRIRDWEAEHPQHQFGKHQYTLERYGLTAEQITTTFADYIARFSNCATSVEETVANG